jgi:hypothetical protein
MDRFTAVCVVLLSKHLKCNRHDIVVDKPSGDKRSIISCYYDGGHYLVHKAFSGCITDFGLAKEGFIPMTISDNGGKLHYYHVPLSAFENKGE